MDDKPWTEYPPASVDCAVTAHPSDAHDYDSDASIGYRDVPAGPIAEFIASLVEGVGDRGIAAMQAIAGDEQWGPIYLTRLVASAEVAARGVGGGLLTGVTHSARSALVITQSVAGDHLSDMVAAIRGEGIQAATVVAQGMTPDQRFRVLDALTQYASLFLTAALHGPENFLLADNA